MVWMGSGYGLPRKLTPIYKRVAGMGSFYLEPIVFYDQVIEYVGNFNVRTEMKFRGSDSSLVTFSDSTGQEVIIDTVPLQFHTARTSQLPFPPEGSDHRWGFRSIDDQGPTAWEFDPPTEGEWQAAQASPSWMLRRPVSGTAEATSVIEIGSLLTADDSLVKLYARATVTVRYIKT